MSGGVKIIFTNLFHLYEVH